MSKAKSLAHDIVVVRGATKKCGIDADPDIQRLQVICGYTYAYESIVIII